MNAPASTLIRQPLRFAEGLLLPLRALALMFRSGGVGGRSLLCGILSAILFLAILFGVFWFTEPLLKWIWPKPEGATVGLWWAAAFFLGALLFLVGVLTVPPLLLSPLLDSLSVATEETLGLSAPEEGGIGAFVKESVRSTGKSVARVVLFLVGHGLLLLLWLIPGFGHALWSFASTAWTLFFLACEYLDYAANRHGYGLAEVMRAVLANPGVCFGYALSAYFLLWVPILNLALVPIAVVGATILFVELRRSGRLPEPKALSRRKKG